MAEGPDGFRGGRTPHLLFARSPGTHNPLRMGGLVPQHWRYRAADIYDLAWLGLGDVDVLLIPDSHDQLFMKSIEPRLMAYLASGGHFLINGHITQPWLPCLQPYKAVSPRPFTNWMIRPADAGVFFGRMDFETFHRWEGILGQYARGYSDPPAGAQWLCLIGGPDDEGPVDWVWRMPGGGKVLMHNGDNIHYFCSDPRHQPNLFHDILNGLVLSDEPAEGAARAGTVPTAAHV
jgi:hypothetical protein